MTPSPDTKGARPEQLVESGHAAYEEFRSDFAAESPDTTWGAAEVFGYFAWRMEMLDALATALSECRERERQLREAVGDFCSRSPNCLSYVTSAKSWCKCSHHSQGKAHTNPLCPGWID